MAGAIVRKPEALPANPSSRGKNHELRISSLPTTSFSILTRRRLLQSFAMAASGATGLGSPLSLARTFMI